MIANKEKNFISVVVYIHNDEALIFNFLDRVNKILKKFFEKYEIILVNDHSNDNSVQVIKNFAEHVDGAVVSIVHMSFYQGVELSMNAGMDLAIGDFVFEFDHVYIDYEIDMIMKVYRRSLEGFDIVSAAPKHIAKKSSRVFYIIFNRFSKRQNKLRTETFRVLSRRVINRVHSMSKTIPYRKAIYGSCGLKADVLIYTNNGGENKSKVMHEANNRTAMAIDSLVLFTDVAYKFALGMTLFMMFASVFAAVYTTIIFWKNQPVAGWTTTMLFLAFGFLGIFAVMAIIIKYLAILVDLVFKKKSYTTELIEKITK